MKGGNATYNPEFVHHQHSFAYLYGREMVFGAQDGMVSALGALTGIAVGSHDHFTVLLSGLAIISVGAISMAIGTYTSITTEKKIEKRILYEERHEIEHDPKMEKIEVEQMFARDGWPTPLAKQMAEHASEDNALMLREMAYRELDISPGKISEPVKNSFVMLFAWLAGGCMPLSPYFFLPVQTGMIFSIVITLAGLFLLGATTSKFTKQNPLAAGLQILSLAGIAIVAGFIIGGLADKLIKR